MLTGVYIVSKLSFEVMKIISSLMALVLTLLLTGCMYKSESLSLLQKSSQVAQNSETTYSDDEICNDPKEIDAIFALKNEPGIYPYDQYLRECPVLGNELLKSNDMRSMLAWYVMNIDMRNKKLWDELPEVLRVNYFVDSLVGEVNNGGYEQYFTNSSGEYKDQIVVALEKISAYKAADITQRAVALEDTLDSYSSSLQESIDSKLFELDGEFYDVGQSDIDSKLDVYLRQNADVIHEWMKLHAKEYIRTALPSKK